MIRPHPSPTSSPGAHPQSAPTTNVPILSRKSGSFNNTASCPPTTLTAIPIGIKKIVSLKDKINEELFKDISPEEFEQTEKTLNKIRSCLDKKIRRDAL